MPLIQIELYHRVAQATVELRYFADNPNRYEPRSLLVQEIADLLELAETDYYTVAPEDFVRTGQRLYAWLDGSDRWLTQQISQVAMPGAVVALAIATTAQLAHLPWELLHDGRSFLIDRVNPAIVPLRSVAAAGEAAGEGGRSPSGTSGAALPAPANRALRVLFMATDPEGVEPKLGFEQEEASILAATERQPLELQVEESGCLSELQALVTAYGVGEFDVFHLTGHALQTSEGARFTTETEVGELHLASAAELAQALRFRLPRLIFLSGCRTGQAGQAGAFPSMAEELVGQGARAVLGWGRPVRDTDATQAAAALYQALATGLTLLEAIALTYQKLRQAQARDWHLLRLWVARSALAQVADQTAGALVTPPRTPGRAQVRPASLVGEFLDADRSLVRVATRLNFVGRRRLMQQCLRALRSTAEPPCVGVVLHGMGGLGKSSVAARLVDRHPDWVRLVVFQRLDEPTLVNRLTAELFDHADLQQRLQGLGQNYAQSQAQNQAQELRDRLRSVFVEMGRRQPDWRLLVVLDDFEANLEPRAGQFVLLPEAARVLRAWVDAIQMSHAPHRLILTARYDFEFSGRRSLWVSGMDALLGADLQKKCDQLAAFQPGSPLARSIQARAIALAGGNPRLLDWLSQVLVADQSIDREALLDRLAANPQELRVQVLADLLLEQIDAPLQAMLQRGRIFELPVPRSLFVGLTATAEPVLERAIGLGLVEVSWDGGLRVSRILPLALEWAEAQYRQAAEMVYQVWWVKPTWGSEAQRLEMHRLAMLGKVESIAVKMAQALANRWTHQCRYRDAETLSRATLALTDSYLVWHELARSTHHTDGLAAIQYYTAALNRCPTQESEDDIRERAAIIHRRNGSEAPSF